MRKLLSVIVSLMTAMTFAQQPVASGRYSGDEKAAPLRQSDHVCDSGRDGFQAALHRLRQGVYGSSQ